MDDFDRVEEVLVARDARLKEEIEVERLMRIQAEEELRKKEEQCQRMQESCKTLLKEMKNNGLDGDEHTIIIEEPSCHKCDLEEAIKKNLLAENQRLAQEKRRAEAMVESRERTFQKLNEVVNVCGLERNEHIDKRQRIKSAPAWARDFYS